MNEFRVAEVFGPTIQGEGRRIGTPCYFIRFAGCDYKCKWCDSPHAVLPEFVNQVEKKSAIQIYQKLRSLPRGPRWVVFSGGNPALFKLDTLVAMLSGDGYDIMVETQGTVYNQWLRHVDDLCVSPKPPSSGNVTSVETLRTFLGEHWTYIANPLAQAYLKVVVFDDEDYAYAREMHKAFDNLQFFLSVGNADPSLPTVGNPHPSVTNNPPLTRSVVLDRMKWLMEKVASDPTFRNARVTPQMHVLAWGNERGR